MRPAVTSLPPAARSASRTPIAELRAGGGDPGRPAGGEGGGGGGGGGGDDDARHESGPPVSVIVLGTSVLVCFVTMMFTGFVGAYVVLRFSQTEWPPAGSPPLPSGLWASTALLVASSVCLFAAQRAVRRDRLDAARHALRLTLGLGVAFMIVQAFVWKALLDRGLSLGTNVYGGLFYLLTGAHALHVAGGLVILARLLAKAGRSAYTAAAHEGLKAGSLYWHALDVIWVSLFAVLIVIG